MTPLVIALVGVAVTCLVVAFGFYVFIGTAAGMAGQSKVARTWILGGAAAAGALTWVMTDRRGQ